MASSASPPGGGFRDGVFRGDDPRSADGGGPAGDGAVAGGDASDPGFRPAGGPGPPAPGNADGRDVRCKLLRRDGSEWTVTGLSLGADGLHVDAYRYVSDGRTPVETRREHLEDELLRPRDRVWCLDRRGAVIWRLSSPAADDRPAGPEGQHAAAHEREDGERRDG